MDSGCPLFCAVDCLSPLHRRTLVTHISARETAVRQHQLPWPTSGRLPACKAQTRRQCTATGDRLEKRPGPHSWSDPIARNEKRPLPPPAATATSPAQVPPHPPGHRGLIVPHLLVLAGLHRHSGNVALPRTHIRNPQSLHAQGESSGIQGDSTRPSTCHPVTATLPSGQGHTWK